MRYTRFFSLTTMIAITFGSIACSQTKDPTPQASSARCAGKIGIFTTLTGPSPGLGISSHNGALLAVNQFQEKNPSCAIEVTIKDSPQTIPSKAADIARELADDPTVIGVIGPGSSNDSLIANRILSQAGLTLIAPTAILASLSEQGNVTFHRVLGNNTSQGPAATRYLTNSLQLRTVFIVDDEGASFSKSIVAEVKKGMPTAGSATFQAGQTDFAPIVDQIAKSGAEAVFFGGYYAEAGLLAKRLREAGSSIPLLTNSAVLDDDYLVVSGPAGEGTLIFSPAVPPEKLDNNFVTAYRNTYGIDPEPYAAEGFDAANIILQGIKAGHTNRPDMEAFVDAYDGEGLTGKIRFTPTGNLDPYVVSVWAYKVLNGKFSADQEMYASPGGR